MRERTDTELVAATLAGERAAFGELIDRHRPHALAVTRRMLRDPLEAEDVVQEALLQAFLGLAALREPACFGAWLAGIAANIAKMRLRSPNRGFASLEALSGGRRMPHGLLAAPDPSPEEAAEARELLGLVRAAVDLLPDGQREVVLMHYVDGLSCQEIASLLERSTVAVRVRLHRARVELRERLRAAHPAFEALPGGKRGGAMIDVTIEDVVVRAGADGEVTGRNRIVLLRERDGERMLPIWIGFPEGDALALQLGGAQTPRPLTIDLAVRMLEPSGMRVERVTVSSLRENTFYAIVVLSDGEREHELDARPSDALNLALRADAPVSVDPVVMQQAGVPVRDPYQRLEEERAKMGGDPDEPGQWKTLTPELVMATWPRPA